MTVITMQMIEDFAEVLANDMGDCYKNLEFAELTLMDLQRRGCDHLGISCDACPRGAYNDDNCPVNQWYHDNPNVPHDELDKKIIELERELRQNIGK
jgi:hypothetical protein